jgi:hypothetical protein
MRRASSGLAILVLLGSVAIALAQTGTSKAGSGDAALWSA